MGLLGQEATALAVRAQALAESLQDEFIRIGGRSDVTVGTLASMIGEVAGLVAATLERLEKHSQNASTVAHGG